MKNYYVLYKTRKILETFNKIVSFTQIKHLETEK